MAWQKPQGQFRLNKDSPLAEGLVLWLPLSDGRLIDRVGGVKFTPASGGPYWVNGKMGRAASFLNTSARVLYSTVTPITAVPFTLSCWFQDDLSSTKELISIADSAVSASYWSLASQSSSNPRVIRMRSAISTVTTTSTTVGVPIDTWGLATMTAKAANDRWVYVNGGFGVQSTTSSTPTGIDRIGIGALASSSPGNYFSGQISDVCLWERALSAEEVARLYDPKTRWELYEPVIRPWFVGFVPAAGVPRAFTASPALATATPTPILAVLRRVAVVGPSLNAITPSGSLVVRRDLEAAADLVSASPATFVLANRQDRSAAAPLATATPTGTLPTLRRLTASAAQATATPTSPLPVARLLTASVTAPTTTPAFLLGLRLLAAVSAALATATPTGTLPVARPVTLTAASISVTPASVNVPVARAIAAACAQGPINVPTVNLAVLRLLAASEALATVTPTVALLTARALLAAAALATVTPVAELPVARLVTVSAAAPTTTATALMAVLRELDFVVDPETTTGASNATIWRDLQFLVEIASSAVGATLITGATGQFSGQIVSLTGVGALQVARSFAGTLAGQTATATPVLRLLRRVTATAGLAVATSDPLLAVWRTVVTSMPMLALADGFDLPIARDLLVDLEAVSQAPDAPWHRVVGLAVDREAVAFTPDTVRMPIHQGKSVAGAIAVQTPAGLMRVQRSLAALLASVTATGQPPLAIQLDMGAAPEIISATAEAAVLVRRLLSGQAATLSLTPTIVLDVFVLAIGGIITLHFSARQPGVRSRVRVPGTEIAARQPGLSPSSRQPGTGASARQPGVTFITES